MHVLHGLCVRLVHKSRGKGGDSKLKGTVLACSCAERSRVKSQALLLAVSLTTSV
jgi:hypothetical protein